MSRFCHWIKTFFGWPVADDTPHQSLMDRLSDDPMRNGLAAERLLNDPLLKQAFENVRSVYLKRFESAKVGEEDAVKVIHLSLQALKDVRSELLKWQFNGQQYGKDNDTDQRVIRNR